jgi:hypothetical protein
MDKMLRDFEAGLGPVEKVKVGDGFVARPVRKDLYTAVLLKLAFLVSTLRAALAVNEAGLYMQQALLCRAIDEANEDVTFMVIGELTGNRTELHEKFLEAFWAEEYEDHLDPVGTHRSRPMVARKRIQAYLARAEGKDLDPSNARQVLKVLTKSYSGFVHAAAPHIMESFGGVPPKFQTGSMRGTQRQDEYDADLWNYVYRGLLSFLGAAKLYGSQRHVDAILKMRTQAEQTMGKDYLA